MSDWSTPPQLARLAAFYEHDAAEPSLFNDESFLEHVEGSFWPTNCWDYVAQTFAIISPACQRRPHLTKQLIRKPIAAMIAGGLEDPAEAMAQRLACATKSNLYVSPTEEGKQWLINEWPMLEGLIQEVFSEILINLEDDLYSG